MLKENRDTTFNRLDIYDVKPALTTSLITRPVATGHAMFEQLSAHFFNEMRDNKSAG